MKKSGMRCVTTAAIVLAALAAAVSGAGELRVGAAAVKITPPAGTPMAGYYSARGVETVHDDLFARAVVLERDGAKAAIVSLDVITTTRTLVAAIRAALASDPGIPEDAVLVSATHTHTGPVILDRGRYDAAIGGESPAAARYNAELPGLVVEAVRKAHAALAPAAATATSGAETSISFNRRFHMKDGTVAWNPGKLNPGIVRPAGPVDPEVQAVWFGPDAAPAAVCVNFAVHLDNVGGAGVSADLPYTLTRSLAEARGTNLVTLFQNGCCGDVNHLDVTWAAAQKGHGNAARMGTILAADVLRALPGADPVAPGPLRFARTTVALPLAAVDEALLARAREVAARMKSGATPPPKFMEQVEALKALDVADRAGRPLEAEVQAIALGPDLAWVGMPGEVFTELGMAVKKTSPFKRTLVVELANGSVGYVPARHAWAEGNYEVVSARCAEGSGEQLVEAAAQLLKRLHDAP